MFNRILTPQVNLGVFICAQIVGATVLLMVGVGFHEYLGVLATTGCVMFAMLLYWYALRGVSSLRKHGLVTTVSAGA